MISKQYFEETFSLATAQALQTWANDNIITPTLGDYAMSINYADNGGAVLMYAETELTGLTVDNTYTVRMYINNITSNAFRIFINALPNDNSSAILQEGWISTPAWKEFSFVATATTMYLAIGDDSPSAGATTSTVDNVTVKDSGGINYVTNSTFESNDTTGWYGQSINTELSIYQYAVEPPLPGDNPYLEAVNIPEYVDTGDDKDGLITKDNGRWNSDYLNRDDITNFYIEPGDYKTEGIQNITRSGTAVNPRTISLHNGNDNHPGTMSEAQNAQVAVLLQDADYWIFDRMSTFGGFNDPFRIIRSQHVILNRHFVDTNGYPILVDNGSHYFTIQKSRVQGFAAGDAVAVNVNAYTSEYIDGDGNKHYKILHSKMIQCEIVNQNDGWQPTVTPIVFTTGPWQYGNVGGAIVNDCDFYLTDITDRENGTDSKCGSPDPFPDASHDNDTDNPTIDCIISGNRFWGYTGRSVDTGSAAIIASMYSPGYKIYDNVVFDCSSAISGGGNPPATGVSEGYRATEIYNNVFYQCGRSDGGDRFTASMNLNNSRQLNMHDNYIIEPQADKVGRFADNNTSSYFTDNRVVDPLAGSFTIENRTDVPNDSTWNTSTATTYEQARTGFTDYVFYKDKYTNTPTLVTLPNVLDPNGTIVSPV